MNIKIKNLGDSHYECTNTTTGKSITCYKQYFGVTNKKGDKHISISCWSSDGFDSFKTRKDLIKFYLKDED